MEKLKFEESFREAFNEAEISPSDSVWTSVELTLEKNSGRNMKRNMLFLQLLAAASLLFAMGVGGIYYLNTMSSSSSQSISENSYRDNTMPSVKEENASVDSSTPSSSSEDIQKTVVQSSHNKMQHQNSNAEITSVVTASEQKNFTSNAEWKDRELPSIVEIKQPRIIVTSKTVADPGMLLLAKLKDEERKYKTEEKGKKINEKLWTSIGVGAGSFNPNTSAPSINMRSLTATASTSSPTSGASYSVGVAVATKISSRIVLQGGISYLSQNAEFTSSTATESRVASLNEFAVTSSDEHHVATSPYKVNSNLQYMSIPVQAGYIIIDRDFAVQLNAGISTDVFFQNTLTPESDDLGKVSQGAGSDSPYRTINFSGLAGTELSYKVGDHYRIAVNPGLRYALNSIYKSEVATEISPMTFDVALRVRYIFR